MLGKWIAVLLLASPAGIAAAQQPATAKPDQQQSQTQSQSQSAAQKKAQQDPLAAAARRAREQQKNQPRATKVWDNDNLPAKSSGVSVVGAAPAPAESADQSASAQSSDAQQGKSSETSGAPAARKAELQKQLAAAKAHLKSVQTDLDIATRTNQLDQQTYYSNPNYLLDLAGAAKLKTEQSDIDAKKQEVADAQKQVDDLNAKLQELETDSAKS